MQFQSFRVNSHECEQFPGHADNALSFFITIQVMAVTDVSATHQNAVRSQLKGFQDEIGRNPA